MPRLHLNFQNHNFTQVFDGWPSCRAAGPHQVCILPHVRTSDLQRVARAQKNSHSTTCWATDTRDLRKWLLRAKKIRTSPHHMFAHPTRAISAEGCPRANKTCISPHVWASDTPQRVTFRKPAVVLLCGNSSVTISVQITLQEFCRSSIKSGSPAMNSSVNDIAQVLKELPRSWSPVADVGDVVYVVDDEDCF